MTTLTIATWNLENWFTPAAGGPNGSGPRTQEVYDAKLDYLQRTITGIGPDAIAVQEVGDPQAMADLAAACGGWSTALSQHPDHRGIRVGVLSPHPLHVQAEVAAFPPKAISTIPDPDGQPLSSMGRGLLEVRVEIPGGPPLRFATAHLKSKLLTFPNGRRFPTSEDERARGAGYALLRRTAEAVAARVHLNEVMAADPGVLSVLAGDLNDSPDAVTTALLTGPADGDPERPDKGDPVRLYNLADHLPVNRAYSRIYNGHGELIDHLLVSRGLLLAVTAADCLVEGITSIGPAVASRRDAVRPDHAPVLARFRLT